MKKNNIILATISILAIAGTTFARVGNGQDYVQTTSGGQGGSFGVGGLLLGGGSIGSLIVLAIIIGAGYFFLKKIGVWGNVKNTFTNNGKINPLNNANVKNDLMRGNVESALVDAAIGGVIGSIFSKLGSQVGSTGIVDINTEIAKIKATDPGFNEQAFKDKAETAFFKLQEGWKRQDLSIMRPFVSDSILSRFTNQLSDMKSRGEKNTVENVVIGHMDITDIRSDMSFNYITVKIDASATDYTTNTGGDIVKGSKTPNGFTERWTFLRTIGTKTNADKQLKDNKCPNCGAALQVNATGKCDYCGAVITSGQYDWVLSEIQQG